MFQERIMLTVNDIYNKEFKLDTRGYRPQEVDKYLDVIMRDYEEFISIIKEQNHEIKQLTEDNLQLKQEIRILRTKIEALKDTDSDSGSSNVDVLKRLSNLEKIIYGK
ncbi:MAG: cell division regulator GpsB [Acholeplasma sp.]|jgi:DivIVA domain-containing protein|nr:cell division regulator GpsB [Acholeplasma sp.]